VALDRVALAIVSDDLFGTRITSVIFIWIFMYLDTPSAVPRPSAGPYPRTVTRPKLKLITKYYSALLCTRYPTRTDVLNTLAMKIYEVYNTDENIGPAPAGVCSRPKSKLPASWIASCKSKGRMKRTGERKQKIHGKTQKVAGKRSKGKKYGGPLPDYSA